jgi:hypothetical protein
VFYSVLDTFYYKAKLKGLEIIGIGGDESEAVQNLMLNSCACMSEKRKFKMPEYLIRALCSYKEGEK